MVKNKSCREELEILKEDFGDLKQYLDELREILPVAICTLSSFWVIADANKALTTLTGHKFLEIIGQPVDFIFGEKEALEKIKKEAENGREILNKEMTLTVQSQKTIPVNISLAVRQDQKGNPIGYFLAITDITEMKKYQKDLEERVEELEKFYRVTVGRELKIVKLKEEIKKLEKGLEEHRQGPRRKNFTN